MAITYVNAVAAIVIIFVVLTASQPVIGPSAGPVNASLMKSVSGSSISGQPGNRMLLYFPNGTYFWYFSSLDYGSVINITVAGTNYFGLSLNYTRYVNSTIYVEEIGNVFNNNATHNPEWSLWIWNSGLQSWILSVSNSAGVSLNGSASFAWSYSYMNANGSSPLYPPAPTPSDPYPVQEFHGSFTGTGSIPFYSNTPVLPPYDRLSWMASLPSSIYGGSGVQPIESGGLIYILASGQAGNVNATLFAFNGFGESVWNHTVPGMKNVITSPLVFGNSVIVSTGSGMVFGFNRSSGSVLYSLNLSTQNITSSPVLGPRGYFILNDSGGLYYVAPDGSLYWNYDVHRSCYGVTPAYSDGTLYFGVNSTKGGELLAINVSGTSSASIIWKRDVSGLVLDSPAVSGGKVYFTQATIGGSSGSHSYGAVYATVLDARTGSFAVNYSFGPSAIFPSSPLITHNSLIFTDSQGTFAVNLSRSNNSAGYVMWSYAVNVEYSCPSPSAFGSYIVVPVDGVNSDIMVLSGAGNLLWNYTVLQGSTGYLSEASYNGAALTLGNSAGNVLSFRNRDVVSFNEIHHNGTVYFTAMINGNITNVDNYSWYFGPQSISYGKYVKHSYVHDGPHQIVLTVRYSHHTVAKYVGYVYVNNVTKQPVTVSGKNAPTFLFMAVTTGAIIASVAVFMTLLLSGKLKFRRGR